MKPSDRDLGMDRPISRRDFIQGASAAVVAGALPSVAFGEADAPPAARKPYPPGLSGLRGSQAGSFEAIHDMVFRGKTFGAPEDTGETYDLVVVGAGVSGLSAAFFYQQTHPNARILILENHDDFGGHARRNEFTHEGRQFIGYGGSQSIDSPSGFSKVALGLLDELAIDLEKFETAYDQGFYGRHGLGPGIHFDRETFGTDRTIQAGLGPVSSAIPGMAEPPISFAETVDQMPIAAEARAQLRALGTLKDDVLPDHSIFSELGYLGTISYETFLSKHAGVTHPQALHVMRDFLKPLYAHGFDAIPAADVLPMLPGINRTSLGILQGLFARLFSVFGDPYIYHFPDGNGSVARLLVRRLMPHVAPGNTMTDIVDAPFDYARLDGADAPVRLRLNSPVIHVANEGAAATSSGTQVTYLQDGRPRRVRAKACILACYNMAIPHLCPELPSEQKTALRLLVKAPLVGTTTLVRNWHAFKKLGVGYIHSPGRWHTMTMMDFPVSLGSVQYPSSPDEPVLVHGTYVPSTPGMSPQDQFRTGRHRLLATSFEDYEREVRGHLGGMLGEGGFDPATDILGLTVNRWPHGYAWERNALFDPDYAEGEAPNEIGRRPYGRISIANSDAGARAYLDCAIDEGWRAVQEVA